MIASKIILLLLFIFLFFSCSAKDNGERFNSPEKPFNLIVVTIDTLRSDYLGCYGNGSIRTPVLDRLSREGILFINAISQASITNPSHCSIMTGLNPLEHGVLKNQSHLGKERVTLAEILKREGYRTCAVSNISPGDVSGNGIGQGFDHYQRTLVQVPDQDKLLNRKRIRNVGAANVIPPEGNRLMQSNVDASESSTSLKKSYSDFHREHADAVTNYGLEMLRQTSSSKFFLWLHYFDPHQPYEPRKPFNRFYTEDIQAARKFYLPKEFLQIMRKKKELSSSEIDYVKGLYRGEISCNDSCLGALMNYLSRKELIDHTLIIITADHGEILYERDFCFGHAGYLHDAVIHIPLLFYSPSILPEGKLVPQQVRTTDILPTTLELMGIEHPDVFNGDSLVPAIRSRPTRQKPALSIVRQDLFSLRYNGWKCIMTENGELTELYNLKKDPLEKHNLADESLPIKKVLKVRLTEKLNSLNTASADDAALMEAEEIEALRGLGYID